MEEAVLARVLTQGQGRDGRGGREEEMKAIELVFRAQPMVAALREVARQCGDNPKKSEVEADCDKWLDAARELLEKKGKVRK